MITRFVIFCPGTKMMIRQGAGVRVTYNLNYAKHFSTEWSAQQFLKKLTDPDLYIIKAIIAQ